MKASSRAKSKSAAVRPSLAVKRVYEPASADDGLRLLVDRIWPRGLTKEKAGIDLWLKEAAPSDALRKWFGHEPGKWNEFKRRYFAELDGRPDAVREIAEKAANGKVTILFGAKETRFNNAVALKEYLETRL